MRYSDEYYYQIVEEEYFREKLDSLREKYPRIDDVWGGICWNLARDPFSGVPVPHEVEYKIFKSTAIGPTPSFWFLYKVEENKKIIRFISIEAVDED